MPKKTQADYQAEQKAAESLLMGVVDVSVPATPAPQRVSVAALKATGQIRDFREVSPGVLRYVGNRLNANLRITPKEGTYQLWDMSQNGGTFITQSSNLDEIERVLKQEFGASLDSDRVELEGLKQVDNNEEYKPNIPLTDKEQQEADEQD